MRAVNREGIGALWARLICLGLGVLSLTAHATVYVCTYRDGTTVFRSDPCLDLELERAAYSEPVVRVVFDPCVYATSIDPCVPSLTDKGKCPDVGQNPYKCGQGAGKGRAPVVAPALAVAPPGEPEGPSVGPPGVYAKEATVVGKDGKPVLRGLANDLQSTIRYNLGTGLGPPGTITPNRR